MRLSARVLCVFALGLAAALAAQAGALEFRLLQTRALPGEGGWDYLSADAAGHRLFISRATRVQVVDPDDGRLLGEIADTPGVHGIALAPELGKGYTSNGRENTVTVFALADLKPITKITLPAADNPDAIAYDAATQQVVTFNGKSHNASLIDAASDRPVATIALDGKPESAASDGRGLIFVAIEDHDEVQAIDLKRHVVVATLPLAGCDEPSALAIDRERRHLFAGCHNRRMVVIDADSGQALATLPIGAGVDAMAYDAASGLVFSSQGDGSLSIVGRDGDGHYALRQTVATAPGARTLALDERSHRVYLVSADFEAPASAPAAGRERRRMKPGSFKLLVVGG